MKVKNSDSIFRLCKRRNYLETVLALVKHFIFQVTLFFFQDFLFAFAYASSDLEVLCKFMVGVVNGETLWREHAVGLLARSTGSFFRRLLTGALAERHFWLDERRIGRRPFWKRDIATARHRLFLDRLLLQLRRRPLFRLQAHRHLDRNKIRNLSLSLTDRRRQTISSEFQTTQTDCNWNWRNAAILECARRSARPLCASNLNSNFSIHFHFVHTLKENHLRLNRNLLIKLNKSNRKLLSSSEMISNPYPLKNLHFRPSFQQSISTIIFVNQP